MTNNQWRRQGDETGGGGEQNERRRRHEIPRGLGVYAPQGNVLILWSLNSVILF